MSRYYVALTAKKTKPGWPEGVTRYYVYQDGECSAIEALLKGLSVEQRLAQTSDSIPPPLTDSPWTIRNCGAISNGSITALSCTEVGSHTIISATAVGLVEINIQANGNGASWGDYDVWYATERIGGGAPPASGTYQKDWPFHFYAGSYKIRGRIVGETDESKYALFNYTGATGADSPGPTVPDTGTPTSASLTQHLGTPRTYQGIISPTSRSSHPDFCNMTVNDWNAATKTYKLGDTSSAVAGQNEVIGWQVDGVWFTNVNDIPRRSALTACFVRKVRTAANADKSQWTNQTALKQPPAEQSISII